MKTKNLLIFAIILTFSCVGFAQVKITSKKVKYGRPKKTVLNEYKQTFEINYPVISGSNGKKIEAILSFEKNFDFKLKEQQKGDEYWLDSCDFKVNYNKNDILDLTLFMEGSGAYPSISTKYLIVNLKTGIRVKPLDVFTNPNGLAAMVRKAQQAEIKSESERIKKEEPDFDPAEYFNNAKYTTENLWSFTVSEKGIIFHYEYGFPHVALALQPDGDYFYKWSELKPFIRKDGLFGMFVK